VQNVISKLFKSPKDKKRRKKSKKCLTSSSSYDIIYKLTPKGRHAFKDRKTSLVKKVEKTFRKGIDKRERKWYNRKVDARAAADDP